MFSVLMAFYNGDNPSHLEDSLASVMVSPVFVRQVVCVQDGPVSMAHIDALKPTEKRCYDLNIDFKHVILCQNMGLGLALNEGCSYCDQEFIVRMDSDDISVGSRFQGLHDFINANPSVDAVGGQIEEFSEKIGDLKRIRKVPVTSSDIEYFSRSRNPMNHVTTCIRKTALCSVGGYEDILWHEDYFLWLKFIHNNYTLLNMSETQVYVRVSNLSSRRSGREYLKKEIIFLKRAFDSGYLSFFECARYLGVRAVARLGPNFINNFIYKLIRK
jgi:glycosyltransferase involved in cell wall biosynthesis